MPFFSHFRPVQNCPSGRLFLRLWCFFVDGGASWKGRICCDFLRFCRIWVRPFFLLFSVYQLTSHIYLHSFNIIKLGLFLQKQPISTQMSLWDSVKPKNEVKSGVRAVLTPLLGRHKLTSKSVYFDFCNVPEWVAPLRRAGPHCAPAPPRRATP